MSRTCTSGGVPQCVGKLFEGLCILGFSKSRFISRESTEYNKQGINNNVMYLII
jgi:hypothetical protein